jgi:hypothetical protein
MAPTVSPNRSDRQHRLPDIASQMARAGVRLADVDSESQDFRLKVARAINIVQCETGSLKEFAALIDRDEREVAKWMTADRRPHLDAIFAVPILRRPMVVALAWTLASDCVEIETVIRIRKVA